MEKSNYYFVALFFLCLFFASEVCHAHGITRARSKCRWYHSRFAVTSLVQSFGVPRFSRDSGCNGAFVPKHSRACVWQTGTSNPLKQEIIGEIYCYSWFASRGKLSDLERDLLSSFVMDYDSDTLEIDSSIHEFSRISTGVINFSDSGVTIYDISGQIKVLGDPVKSEIELTVWLPEDNIDDGIADTLIDPDKTIKSFKISVTNEGVYQNDFEDKGDFVTYYSQDTAIVDFYMDSIFVKFPEDLDVDYDDENFDVEVYIESHGEAKNIDAGKKEIIKTSRMIEDGELFFNVYPNPAKSHVNIEFNNKSNSNEKIKEITIYDNRGAIVLSENYIADSKISSLIDINSWSSGIYYIRVVTNSNSYISKLVVD